MIKINYHFLYLLISIIFISTTASAQSVNYDETWKEFLDNNKISKTSDLNKPDKVGDRLDYAKYLLMNTNSRFCQSEIKDAERLMAEVKELDPRVHEVIPGFVEKMEELDAKIESYHSIDLIWNRFLRTRVVNLEELEDVKAAKTVCEKKTLAKYSYMTAYYHFCQGNIAKSKDILENRTLRLTEKTTLRVKDVEGLGEEVSKMKILFRNMSKLDVAWGQYMRTGNSPGFAPELPLFPCNPIPNMKALALKGAVDICNLGPSTLEKIQELQAKSSVAPDGEVAEKIRAIEAAIQANEDNLAVLNDAWAAFIPNNETEISPSYTYKYCTKEPLIRAYIMDGFSNVCGNAEEMLENIDAIYNTETIKLDKITRTKINELAALSEQYKSDVVEVENMWRKFVAQGDDFSEDYQVGDYYCDNVHQVKYWLLEGLSGNCSDGIFYLEQIEEVQATFEFTFVDEVECRIQRLRIKVWECRHQALLKLARTEAPNAHEERLQELMEEYGVGVRPEDCSTK